MVLLRRVYFYKDKREMVYLVTKGVPPRVWDFICVLLDVQIFLSCYLLTGRYGNRISIRLFFRQFTLYTIKGIVSYISFVHYEYYVRINMYKRFENEVYIQRFFMSYI